MTSTAQTDTQALDRLAEWLWQDDDEKNPQFPSGADTCEELDDALRTTGRSPQNRTLGDKATRS